MDKRLACFPAEKHLIKTGSFAGFLENIQSVFIKNRRSIGRFGQERNGSISFDLAKEWRTVFAKTKYLGIGDMSGCFFFQIKKDPDKISLVFRRSANWEKLSYWFRYFKIRRINASERSGY